MGYTLRLWFRRDMWRTDKSRCAHYARAPGSRAAYSTCGQTNYPQAPLRFALGLLVPMSVQGEQERADSVVGSAAVEHSRAEA